MNIDIESFAVPDAQESQVGLVQQFDRGPHPFSFQRPASLVVDQAKPIYVVRHGRELASHSDFC
jgi:hypothetical protein